VHSSKYSSQWGKQGIDQQIFKRKFHVKLHIFSPEVC